MPRTRKAILKQLALAQSTTELKQISDAMRDKGYSEKDEYPVTSKVGQLERATSKKLLDYITEDEAVKMFQEHEDPRFRELARSLTDPDLRKKSFMDLYKRVGLSFGDIMQGCKTFYLERAVLKLSQGAPQVAEGIVEDASPKLEFCPKCDGIGKIPDLLAEVKERTCPQCNGDGKVRVMGDKDSKKMVLESTGILKQAPVVAIQQNLTVGPMEEVVRFKRIEAEVIEGEVIDANGDQEET